jgi:hypothetical protein
VLALLRAPSGCVLRKAVAAAAMAHGGGGRAAFAYSSDSAFLPSALERGLGLGAPAASQQGRDATRRALPAAAALATHG